MSPREFRATYNSIVIQNQLRLFLAFGLLSLLLAPGCGGHSPNYEASRLAIVGLTNQSGWGAELQQWTVRQLDSRSLQLSFEGIARRFEEVEVATEPEVVQETLLLPVASFTNRPRLVDAQIIHGDRLATTWLSVDGVSTLFVHVPVKPGENFSIRALLVGEDDLPAFALPIPDQPSVPRLRIVMLTGRKPFADHLAVVSKQPVQSIDISQFLRNGREVN